MSKTKTIYVCAKCDGQFPKWSGRCSECGAWDSLDQQSAEQVFDLQVAKKVAPALTLEQIRAQKTERLSLNVSVVNTVLGGGLPKGSLTIFTGDPGVGKSTLACQIIGQIKALYSSAEEPLEQLAERAERLGAGDNLRLIAENSLEVILATASTMKIDLLIVDSLQTISSQSFKGERGSLAQAKYCLETLNHFAKQKNLAVLVIGHVTKSGDLAGPKFLEHLADIVLFLEGERTREYRILKTWKNRFATTRSSALLEMTKNGFSEVKNPSALFLKHWHNQSGNCIAAASEDQQVFLVEVQAMLTRTGGKYPRRSASGFEQKRLEILAKVLAKKLNLKLDCQDIYINIAGGLSLSEPALDLAICASIVSAYFNLTYPEKIVFFGEVGLSGEVRTVVKTAERLKEAVKMGYKTIVLPDLDKQIKGLDLKPLRFVQDLDDLLVR